MGLSNAYNGYKFDRYLYALLFVLVIYIGLPIYNCDNKGAGVMVLNATFNNILDISLRFIDGEKKHRPVANCCYILSRNVL
jgi:hypothetical protein